MSSVKELLSVAEIGADIRSAMIVGLKLMQIQELFG